MRIRGRKAPPGASPCPDSDGTAVAQPAREGVGGSGDVADAEAMVRCSSMAPCLTCVLCGGFLHDRDAITMPECLHAFCRECIEHFTHVNINSCPKCNIDLGFNPLKKLRISSAVQSKGGEGVPEQQAAKTPTAGAARPPAHDTRVDPRAVHRKADVTGRAEDLNPSGQTGEQPGAGHSAETLRTDSVPESPGARRFAGDSTTAADRVGGGERSATTTDDSTEMPGATARAAESSKAEAGAADVVPESEAQRPTALEDTTREVKRLRSTLCTVMKQIEGIAQTAEQRQQLIKRMEPLAEKNERLRKAMKLMETNVQKAQRERDLAESNTKDLEYQKDILSEQLKTVSEQLERTSEQLKSVSEQKKEQDAELDRLRQVIGQLQEEKEKASGRAEKLTEDLEEYCRKTKAQFDALELEAKI
ncbi:uncharacterized protein [Miscanthus floridulus]|uniref:uncharacterized protein isoform X2 n=1 Tax=Miscanthus floridulus TaxID=154761 RepID=UPI0034595FF5